MKIIKLLPLLIILATSGEVLSDPEEAAFSLKNKVTGMYLRPLGASHSDGAPMVLFSPKSWKCVTWDLTTKGGSVYLLRNQYTGKTFEAGAEGVWQCSVDPDHIGQQWRFREVDKGEYLLISEDSGLALEPEDGNKMNSRVIVSKVTGIDLQRWILVPQDKKN